MMYGYWGVARIVIALLVWLWAIWFMGRKVQAYKDKYMTAQVKYLSARFEVTMLTKELKAYRKRWGHITFKEWLDKEEKNEASSSRENN